MKLKSINAIFVNFVLNIFITHLISLGQSKSIETTALASNENISTTIIAHQAIVKTSVSELTVTTTGKSILDGKLNNETTMVITGNSSGSNSSNYIVQYKPVALESAEDIKTQQEWGGNCTLAHWDKCKVLESWFGNYVDPKDEEIKNYLIDCRTEPILCLKNSWTVTRCNLLCMARCNREIQFKFDKYVSHNGECKAHAHG